MFSPFPQIQPIKPLNLPELKPIETDSVPRKQGQSLKEFSMAGGGVPLQYKGREHVWHKKVASFAEGGEVHMAEGGAAFGVHPHMKAKRSKQDAEAAKNVPVDLARGFASGVLGAPGDIESLVRMLPGLDERTVLPTSEEVEKRLPFRSESPVSKAAAGMGSLAGGFYTGPGAPIRLAGALPGALKHGAEEFVKASTAGVPHVIKPKGGNWYKTPPNGASIEGSIERLRPYQKQDAIIEHYKGLGQDTSEHEKRHALNQWVENNLQNYIKKQMGTMDDPIRALHEEGITHMPKDVREGLGEVERDTKERRVAAGFPAKGVAKSDLAKEWENLADQNIWSSKAGDVQHAQTVMPELQKADRALKDHESMLTMRFRQKMAENPALSPAERRTLEEKMPMSQKAAMMGDEKHDELLQNRARLAQVANGGDWHIGQNNPWVANVPPETDLYQGIASGMGFDHVIDILKQEVEAGRIRPDQLNKVSISDAVRRTHEFDQEAARKMAEAQIKNTEGMPVHKEYPEGYKWIELAQSKELPAGMKETVDKRYLRNEAGELVEDPRYKSLESALKYEGDTMGHCVGGYCPDVAQGHSRIYSLRSPKGEPHVTIETRPNQSLDYNSWFSKQPEEVQNKIAQRRVEDKNHNIYEGPEYLAAREAMPPRIVQIKGKQNAAPKADYLPYVQDFVKGGEWSDVGDLRNTGLHKVQEGDVPGFAEWMKLRAHGNVPQVPAGYYTPEDLLKFGEESGLKNTYPSVHQKWRENLGLPLEGDEPHLAGGGLLKAGIRALMEEAPRGVEPIVVKAAERAAAGKKAAEQIKAQPQVKASEALGQAMEKGFKRTTTTQADRTRVGGGNIGGAAFPAISEADPLYAGKVWGVMDEGTAARLKNLTDPETAWTTMLGSANQLKTNPIVFDKLKKQFLESMKAGNLSPELESKINHNLAVTFGEGAEIRDPKIWRQADTFEKRAALADLMMGQGLPPKKGGLALGGEKSGKGVIFKPTETLIRETEPTLLHPAHGGEAETFSAGPRLFSMEPESQYRPDLHPGFPTLITGKDLGMNMKPTPTEVYLPDWHRKFKADNPDRKAPGYYDLALGVKGQGLPSQEINDEFIRHLLREGFKAGGAVGGLSAATKSCSCHD